MFSSLYKVNSPVRELIDCCPVIKEDGVLGETFYHLWRPVGAVQSHIETCEGHGDLQMFQSFFDLFLHSGVMLCRHPGSEGEILQGPGYLQLNQSDGVTADTLSQVFTEGRNVSPAGLFTPRQDY